MSVLDSARAAARSLLIAVAVEHAEHTAVGGIMVVAPHPDDETLGCGGRILSARRAGKPVAVVVATDGAASHGDQLIDRSALSRKRSAELAAAVRWLGVEPTQLRELGYPDGQLADHLEALTADLVRELSISRPDEVYCTSAWESHPDHVAAALAVRRAAATLDYRPVLFEYPIWLWSDWPVSRRRLASGPLQLLRLLLRRRIAVVALDDFRAAKESATQEYRSQLGEAVEGAAVGLPIAVLQRSRVGPELFFRIR